MIESTAGTQPTREPTPPASTQTGQLDGRDVTYLDSQEAIDASGCICAEGMHGCCCCWCLD